MTEQDRAISLNAVKDLYCRICMESNLCYRSKEGCGDLRLFDKLPSVKPQEPSNDMVSRGVFEQVVWERDVAIEQLKDLGYELGEKPKTGHWILTDDDFVYCSECEDSYYPRPIDASWYYCPHCGAKMVEPQERSEE